MDSGVTKDRPWQADTDVSPGMDGYNDRDPTRTHPEVASLLTHH